MLKAQNYRGFKIQNKTYKDFPNCYFTLHEGVDGTPPASIADQAGSSLVAVPATNTAGQWTTTPGYWTGTATNTTDYLRIQRSADPAKYDQIFNMNNCVMVTAAYVKSLGDPAASGRVWAIGNLDPNWESQLEVKFLTDGRIQSHWEGSITAVAQNGVDLPAQAAPNECVLLCKLDTINNISSIYCYYPSSSKLITASNTSDISGIGLNTTIASNQEVCIGATMSGAANFQALLQNMAVRDFRAVNFGGNPPGDLAEILNEMALTGLQGTRR